MSHGGMAVYDIVQFNSMVFMFKVYANLSPTNLLSFFKKVNDSHNYNTRNNNNKFIALLLSPFPL